MNIPEKEIYEKQKLYFDIINSEGDEIKNFSDLKHKIKRKDGKINEGKKIYFDFLLKVQEIKGGDPVIVLYNLYKSGLSLRKIGAKFGYSEDKLGYLFTSVFNWKLRDSNERTEIGIKGRNASKDISGLTERQKENHQEAQELYKKNVANILTGHKTEKNKPDIEYFSILKPIRSMQVIYLVSIVYQISIESSISFIKSLRDLASGINTISNQFNCKLEEFLKQNPDFFIEIKIEDIDYITKKYDLEKYKKNEKKLKKELGEISNNSNIGELFTLQYRGTITGIKNREEFNQSLKNTPTHSKNELNSRLDLLTKALAKFYKNRHPIDPIKYFIYLFYQRGSSAKEMENTLKNIGIEWPSSSISNFIKKLGWKRSKTDLKTAKIGRFNEVQKRIVKGGIDGVNIDIDFFKSLKGNTNRPRRILYVISLYYKVPIDTTINFLISLKKEGLFAGFIAETLNSKLKLLFKDNNELTTIISASNINYITQNYSAEVFFDLKEITTFDEIKNETEFRPKKVIENEPGLSSIREYKETQRGGSTEKMMGRLGELEEYLVNKYINQKIDPILFLKYLHYEKGLLMSEISRFLSEEGVVFPKGALKPLKHRLLWITEEKNN